MAEAARDRKLPVDDKIHTWPHLVRMEFLCALFVTVALTLWAMMVDAPLEEPANPTRTPNPSKAPWYFLGLQEMLVYFDPWHAGVVLPTLIIVGTFFRGPGWNLFWPWQHWDAHKVVALTNVDLPYLFGFRDYWWSAIFGLMVIAAYFVFGLAAFYYWVLKVKGREFLERWGMVRFTLTAVIFVLMLSLPAKMFLRLVFNVKYILVTPWINV